MSRRRRRPQGRRQWRSVGAGVSRSGGQIRKGRRRRVDNNRWADDNDVDRKVEDDSAAAKQTSVAVTGKPDSDLIGADGDTAAQTTVTSIAGEKMTVRTRRSSGDEGVDAVAASRAAETAAFKARRARDVFFGAGGTTL